MLDAAVGGSLGSKQLTAAFTLIEDMASTGHQRSSERNKLEKAIGNYEVDALTKLAMQVEAISKRLDKMQVQPQASVMSCETWSSQAGTNSYFPIDGNVSTEQVDYAGQNNRFQNNAYSGTYNSGWRNHSNFLVAN